MKEKKKKGRKGMRKREKNRGAMHVRGGEEGDHGKGKRRVAEERQEEELEQEGEK